MKHLASLGKAALALCLLVLAQCTGGKGMVRLGEGAEIADASRSEQGSTARPERTAEEVLNSFQASYPSRFQGVGLHNGAWAIRGADARYYWAEGRLLPESALAEIDRYTSYPFYRYAVELTPIPDYTEEMKAEVEGRLERLEENPPARHPGIYKNIWRISDGLSAERNMKAARFLKKSVKVHADLVSVLKALENDLLALSRKDAELRRFIDSIKTIYGFHWRKIARTESLSFHAYGAALDILPANPRNKETYWLWAMGRDKEWYTRPLERRLMPPQSFVETFEKHGFVWGGKWFFYDTIHYEYRPEILRINGFTLHR